MFENLLEPTEFRWPKFGDRLFVPATDWDSGVRFSGHHIARASHIWDGYMRAGSVLVDHCKEDTGAKFHLVYAIIFNYRHGLETAIKWVIDRYSEYTSLGTYERNHDLATLWKKCRAVIEEI